MQRWYRLQTKLFYWMQLVQINICILFFTFLKIYFLEERNINVWLPLVRPLLGTWSATQTCALDWESNQQPFDSQAGTQQPGLLVFV